MRWRSEKEVIAGKGQFICGARGCDERRCLATFEVPFSYEEAGDKKQALVKVPSRLHLRASCLREDDDMLEQSCIETKICVEYFCNQCGARIPYFGIS